MKMVDFRSGVRMPPDDLDADGQAKKYSYVDLVGKIHLPLSWMGVLIPVCTGVH
jgi:hypothetical protein